VTATEMTSSGADIFHSVRSVRNAIQASADYVAPGARPKKTGLASVSITHATRTGSALALGYILS
jgi:hypothetical protein